MRIRTAKASMLKIMAVGDIQDIFLGVSIISSFFLICIISFSSISLSSFFSITSAVSSAEPIAAQSMSSSAVQSGSHMPSFFHNNCVY
ncbi:MAG: hypothetical protein U9R34_05515 [Nanoarchaeota archaeon]|nr:hypothetical protein [Nanoarchaeota archaeon]